MISRAFCFAFLAFCAASATWGQTRPLEIYWIDVEGGGATLIVTPEGHSFLADAGNPGERDAQRIFEVATRQAGLKKIDFLFTTHYHGDHVGGAPELAKRMPVERFYDHGESVEQNAPWANYKTLSEGKRTTVQAGDVLPLGGVRIDVVAAAGRVTTKVLNHGGANAMCGGAQRKPEDTTENGQSAGFLLTYGNFRFLDLGDLTWDREMELACPVNRVGEVTLLQATHHGFFNDFSGAPALYHAVKPQVVVVNNGAKKGLQASAYETIAKSPGLEAAWQVHQAVSSDAAHNTAEMRVANNEAEDAGHWLRATVTRDGKVTLTNSRNGHSETYRARR